MSIISLRYCDKYNKIEKPYISDIKTDKLRLNHVVAAHCSILLMCFQLFLDKHLQTSLLIMKMRDSNS